MEKDEDSLRTEMQETDAVSGRKQGKSVIIGKEDLKKLIVYSEIMSPKFKDC